MSISAKERRRLIKLLKKARKVKRVKQRKVFFGRETVRDKSGLKPIRRTVYGSAIKGNRAKFTRTNKATGQKETVTRRGVTLYVPKRKFKFRPKKKQSGFTSVFGNLKDIGF